MTVVVVGKSSFLAKEAAKHAGSREWLFLSHGEALAQPGWLDRTAVVINFAFPPQFETRSYDKQSDVDSVLARMIGARPVHYIMLSSRMVYGQGDSAFKLKEEHDLRPTNHYGMAKLAVERSLESILQPDRLTILRLSNLFGFERGRDSFFGRMMTTLARDKKIIFDMGADTQRDFFPVERFTDTLLRIAATPAAGVFNIGSGLATKCGDVAAWLIEGYGDGTLEITDPAIRDQFSLNVGKAASLWNFPDLKPAALREAVVACGKKLKG